jgi:hypothetical protein
MLVTDINPTGVLTISKFELAATVTHHDVLVHSVDLQERTTNDLHNTTAMSSSSPSALSLLCPTSQLLVGENERHAG